MIIAVVQFRLAAPISLEDATRKFQSSAPKYVALPGLVRKHYIRAADGSTAGGVYLWQSRAAAEAVYTGEWLERVRALYGSEPEVLWFDAPVSVDNTAGGTILTDA